jgi:hypothetical protein
MSDEKPRKVPLERLRAVVESRVSAELAHEEARGGKMKPTRRNDQTKPERRDFISQCEPGGENYHYVERALKCEYKRERVRYIANLMSCGEWRTALVSVLASAWNVDPSSVRLDAAEASRYVRAALGDPEQIRATASAFLETIAQEARANGDRRSAVAAVRTLAEISGVLTHRTEVTGANGGPIRVDLRSMSDEELQRRVIEVSAQVLAECPNGGIAVKALALLEEAKRGEAPDAVFEDVPKGESE